MDGLVGGERVRLNELMGWWVERELDYCVELACMIDNE